MKDISEPEKKENDNYSPSNPIEEQIGDKPKEKQSDTFDDGKTKE